MAKREDDRLQLRLTNKLSNLGLRSPSRVHVEVYHGDVTIKGVVQFEYQRKAAVTAVRSMDGVESVIDQLKVQAPTRAWDEEGGDSSKGGFAAPSGE